MHDFVLAVHGGAFMDSPDYARQTEFLQTVLQQGHDLLAKGASATDVVVHCVSLMEDSALYIAGKGSGANSAGYFELDSSIMDGKSGKAGAVASLRNYKNPIQAARLVMDESPHVLLVAEGAENFLSKKNLTKIINPSEYFSPVHIGSQVENKGSHGTVGAVAKDKSGNLAAGTSTGGLVGKLEGRIGDTPIVGAATYANHDLAVSTTGYGEYFMRLVAAYDVKALYEYAGQSLEESVETVLSKIKQAGGWGGMIAIDRKGLIKLGFCSNGMHRGFIRQDGIAHVWSYS